MFKCSCLHFPTTASLTLPPPPPTLNPTPFDFVRVSFIHVSWRHFPFFPTLFPSSSPLVTVLNFNVSGYILLACLFC